MVSRIDRVVDVGWREKAVNKMLGAKSEKWGTYHSDIKDYERTFTKVLGGETIGQLVRQRYEELGRPVCVVDFLATPAALRSIAKDSGVEIQGLSASLTDERSRRARKLDNNTGINHLTVDLGAPHAYRDLLDKMGGTKADIVVERGMGGLTYLPKSATYYETALNAMLSVMNDRATLFAQLPWSLDRAGLMPAAACVESLVQQGVEIKFWSMGWSDAEDVIRITKTEQTPKRIMLPRLDT